MIVQLLSQSRILKVHLLQVFSGHQIFGILTKVSPRTQSQNYIVKVYLFQDLVAIHKENLSMEPPLKIGR